MSARLPNGLTPEQDAAFDALAEAIAGLDPIELRDLLGPA